MNTIITVEEARNYLRIDDTDNDSIIEGLIDGAEEYIETTTGIPSTLLVSSPLAKTICQLLISMWYDATQVDTEKLQRTIDSLIKSLTFVFSEEQKKEAKSNG